MQTTLSSVDVEGIVQAATLAPSVLNIQPWRFVCGDNVIEVHRDLSRTLPALDPQNRAVTISCGAALLNLRLAVAHAGRRPIVDVDPLWSHPTLLARVRMDIAGVPTGTETRLFAAIPHRQSCRVPFTDEPIAPECVMRMEGAARSEGAELLVLSTSRAEQVAGLVLRADAEQREDTRSLAEIFRWTGPRPDAVDGIPDVSLGPTPRDPPHGLVRDFAVGLERPGRPSADFEPSPTLALLTTAHDLTRTGSRRGRRWSGPGSRPPRTGSLCRCSPSLSRCRVCASWRAMLLRRAAGHRRSCALGCHCRRPHAHPADPSTTSST
jgi:hypothetical protein